MASKKGVILEPKSIFVSKTFWFGILVIVNAVAGVFGFASYEPGAGLEELTGLISGLGIVGLRYITKTSVSVKGIKND